MSNDWEIVQEKAFTAWVNGILDRVGEKVGDITADFADGVKLAHFLELLSGKKIGKRLELEKKTDIYKIQNVNLALQFAEANMEVKAQGVAAEDFVQGNRKLVLGFLWTLYRKYRIAVIKEGDKSSEEGLLLWCKNITQDYGVGDIKSFKTGFRDGNAFLALAHKYNPDAFNYDEFSGLTPEQKLEKAFEIAEKTINIPKLLDIGEVMKGTTDERSLILYTSLFFHAFNAQAQREALERDTADKLGNLENSLTSAKQTREEMLRKLEDLEKSKADLESSNTTKDGQITELTEENTKLKGEVSDLKAEVTELKGEVSDLKAKGSALEANISELDTKSKSESQQITDLEENVKDQKNRLENSEKSNEELSEKLKKTEEEREALRGERDSERAKLANALVRLDEETKRADAEFSALLLLRQQFDQHVLDMHRWRKLLEVEDIGDFLAEVKTPLETELAKEGGFDVQVKMLRGKLEEETKDIQKYLHEKEEFEKMRLKVDKKN